MTLPTARELFTLKMLTLVAAEQLTISAADVTTACVEMVPPDDITFNN